MHHPPPQSDQSPEPDSPRSGPRRPLTAREADAAARMYWDAEADAYQAEHGAFLAEGHAGDLAEAGTGNDSGREDVRFPRAADSPGHGAGFVWGPEGLTEEVAGLLGPVEGLAGHRVLEIGCGAAQCSRWLAGRGARAVGVDISVAQLRHAGGTVPVAAGTAIDLPFRDGQFATAFASYGAVQFVADLDALLAEVARVLRPGGRWVFSVTHPIRWAFPDEPGPEGLTATRSYFDRSPYLEQETAGGPVRYAEFHRTLGDYVAALAAAGFTIERLVEPPWPEWNDSTWGGWSPLRGKHLPGTLIIRCRAGG